MGFPKHNGMRKESGAREVANKNTEALFNSGDRDFANNSGKFEENPYQTGQKQNEEIRAQFDKNKKSGGSYQKHLES